MTDKSIVRASTKKLLCGNAPAVVTFAMFSVLLGCGPLSARGEVCRAITAIASDAKKMQYVKAWAASRLSEKDFVEQLRTRNTFESNDERSYGGLDWQRIGIEEGLASVEFNLGLSDAGGWDINQIHSVSIRRGRSMIVIRLSSANDLGLYWTPERLAELKPVVEDVFVYCDGS